MKKYYARELIYYNKRLNDFVTFKDYTEYQKFFETPQSHGCPYIRITHNILEWAGSYIVDSFYTLLHEEMFIYYLVNRVNTNEKIISLNKNFLIENF